MALAQRPQLGLETLGDRIVPAVINLTGAANGGISSATLGSGAMVHLVNSDWTGDAGSEGTGNMRRFVRIATPQNGPGVTQGYNTNARPLQFNELDVNATRAWKLKNVPVVTIGGVDYREFVLNVNQTKNKPFVSLDEVRIFIDNTATLSNYNANNGKLVGAKLVYNMDAGGDNAIKLKALRNEDNTPVAGEMALLIPESLFAAQNAKDKSFVYLYSKFGGQAASGGNTFTANGGTEAWGARLAPAVNVEPASLSGTIFDDYRPRGTEGELLLGNGQFDEELDTAFRGFVSLTLSGYSLVDDSPLDLGVVGDGEIDLQIEITDGSGTFDFGNLPVGRYTLSFNFAQGRELLNSRIGDGEGNVNSDGFYLMENIILSSGENASGYDFLVGMGVAG